MGQIPKFALEDALHGVVLKYHPGMEADLFTDLMVCTPVISSWVHPVPNVSSDRGVVLETGQLSRSLN